MINIFMDTNALLLAANNKNLFKHPLYISSITLEEIEHIKTSANKDPEVKYQARQLARSLDENYTQYQVVIYKENMAFPGVEMTPDLKIIACAKSLNIPNLTFITNDVCCKQLARLYLNDVRSYEEDLDEYSGYKEIIPIDEDLAQFYANPDQNIFELKTNQYLILKNKDGEVIDLRCWNGETYRYLKTNPFESVHFGKVSPKDVYQKCAFDSLWNNDITLLKGKAGSGKTLLALSYLFNQLEHGQIDRIMIFCNPIAVKGAAKLGFLPGSLEDKILDSQIGNILASKLGAREEVDKLLDEGQLVLVSMADARGIDTGNHSGIFMTEAQNSDASLMKLLLQRVGEGSKVIIDGDLAAQLDLSEYGGNNNGIRRLSQVFRDAPFYGEATLNKIRRSKIAERADLI